MNAVILDGRCLTHGALADAFGFPPYYGRNLDALADCLGDLAPSAVIVLHAGEADGEGKRVLAVLRGAARDNGNLRLFFAQEAEA